MPMINAATPALRKRRVLEFDARDLLRDDDSPDFRWCEDNATFAHRHACEFLVWLAKNRRDRRQQLRTMHYDGCSESFLDIIRAAHRCRAEFVLIYA